MTTPRTILATLAALTIAACTIAAILQAAAS